MQKLVLYIGNNAVYTEEQRVDLFKDESVSFTQTIQNVKDIKKIFTEFTKTFSIPASKRNNKIFEHYYNFNIANGFDARIKVNAALELNDIPYKTGKIALTGVDLKKNLAHTYKITFFGNTVDLKDILGDTQLSALTSLNENRSLIYSFSNILDRMQTELNDIIVPLISHTDRLIYNSASVDPIPLEVERIVNIHPTSTDPRYNGVNWNQFKYAIRVQAIITAIETTYPTISFSTNFFGNSNVPNFADLFFWLHRNKGNVIVPVLGQANWTTLTEITQTGATIPISPPISSNNGGLRINAADTDSDDLEVSLTVTANSAGSYEVLVRQDGAEVIIQLNGNGVTPTVIFNDATLDDSPLEDNSIYTIEIRSDSPLTFNANSIVWSIDFTQQDDGGLPADGNQVFKNQFDFTTTNVLDFNITQQIPKMSIIDFLTGLFQMFNLTAYVNDSGTIVVQTLDSFYDWENNTSLINIDEYLDVSKSSVDIALPFNSVNFSYKGLGTILAKRYEQEFNSGWGSLGYSLNNVIFDAPEESYKIELPFEHLMYERIYDTGNAVPNTSPTTAQYGLFVDDNLDPYFGQPLLFYAPRISNGTAIRIRDTITTNKTDIDDYFVPSNSRTLINSGTGSSKATIHFGLQSNEYLINENNTPPISMDGFTDGLFQQEYRTYIENVFNNSRRLTTVTAYLPYKIFSSIQLNDVIEIGQQPYWINSMMTDLTTGKTKFELLNKLTSEPQQT
tara:strand:+ start:3172 stop:5373 length:2202 start_codon:yes stop_codon:yes gene_type:complete